jgi:hypothetical protein
MCLLVPMFGPGRPVDLAQTCVRRWPGAVLPRCAADCRAGLAVR